MPDEAYAYVAGLAVALLLFGAATALRIRASRRARSLRELQTWRQRVEREHW